MTPLQFAKEQCSNYQRDGSCLGMGIRDDGSGYSFGRKPKCVLDTKERCGFFEGCVIRMGVCVSDANNATQRARLEKLKDDRDEAKRLYCHNTGAVI